MRAGRPVIAVAAIAAFAGWNIRCSSPRPEQLVAEAQSLAQRDDKASSQQAVSKYVEAMTAWDRRGDSLQAARAANAAGETCWQLGLPAEALRHYRAAAERASRSPDRLLESEVRSNIGTAAAYASDPEAKAQCRQALALAQEHHGDRQAARATNCLGEAAYFDQELDAALEYYEKAQGAYTRLDDQRGLAQTLLNQGYIHSDLSRFTDARACYERVRTIWMALGDRREQAIVLIADARLRQRRGEYQEALDEFSDALTRLEPMGNAMWEGGALTGLAGVHVDMGEVAQALRYWERAIRAFDEAGLEAISTPSMLSLGEAYLASGQTDQALPRLEQALKRADELSNDRYRAFALWDIGAAYLLRRQPHEALKYLNQSLGVQRTLSDTRMAAGTQADLGEAHHQFGEYERAAACLEEALALSRDAEDRVLEARAHFGLARTALARGDPAGARPHVEQALAVVESLRSTVEHRDLRASFLASVHQYYQAHLDVLMRLHRARPSGGLADLAFEASERARARSLLESLSGAAVDLRSGADPDLLRREQMARAAFQDWAERRRRAAGPPPKRDQLAALVAEYRTLEDRHTQIEAEMRRKSPRYAALVKPRPMGLREVQAQLLDEETLLLEYALGDDRSYLWAISKDHRAAYELAPRAEIEREAERVHLLLTARLAPAADPRSRASRVQRADAEYWEAAGRLSEMLLAPVASVMTGKRLVVVADGALLSLPFAALPVPGSGAGPVPLLVGHEVVSLPSASVLAILRKESAGRAPARGVVAVLADPVFEADDPRLRGLPDAATRRRRASPSEDATGPPSGTIRGPEASELLAGVPARLPRLSSTRLEADAIVSAAPIGTSRRKVDFEASRDAAMSPELAGYRIVHFATHGVFDNENPGLSGVALSMFDAGGRPQDGFLRLHDIYGLRLPVDLVVLSACDTALGKPLRGEGLVGVVRGFMHAGAARVVASLWKVDDDATGELMGRFYGEMLQNGRAPAAALRQAQIAMWQQDTWRAPYYWAAFVLQGEWR